ncbi:hypothetical protein [Kocuria rhizophila]|uniref:hypothetical protein n=1 Tax=Kocuria rhizophila TaxID=72000 RepID=UPI0011A49A37|nr:hypothetical protein [Kocuria rhizophila]
MVDLPRSQAIKKLCESHIEAQKDGTLTSQAAIESVLARHIASVIYAEAEACVRDLVMHRVTSATTDPRVTSFSKVASTRLIRSIKISELSGNLNHFGSTCKDHFSNTLTGKQKTDWDSLMNSRHDTAHENSGSSEHLTLKDIDGYFASVSEVLNVFSDSLDK